MNPKPNGRGWTMGMDRELIVLAKTKTLQAIATHFQRETKDIMKKAKRLGLSIKGSETKK
jgi:hypothetical protein